MVGELPGWRTSDSLNRIFPGTSISKRWIFRCFPIMSPAGLKTQHVLYNFPSSCSGIDPAIMWTWFSRAAAEMAEIRVQKNWANNRFLTQISIFDPNLDFWSKFRFLIKISIFDPNFDFWSKFRFLIKISIFDQNLNF